MAYSYCIDAVQTASESLGALRCSVTMGRVITHSLRVAGAHQKARASRYLPLSKKVRAGGGALWWSTHGFSSKISHSIWYPGFVMKMVQHDLSIVNRWFFFSLPNPFNSPSQRVS